MRFTRVAKIIFARSRTTTSRESLLDAALTPALARLGMAAAMTAGPPGLRERLRMLEAGELSEQDTLVLLAELEAMAGLLRT